MPTLLWGISHWVPLIFRAVFRGFLPGKSQPDPAGPHVDRSWLGFSVPFSGSLLFPAHHFPGEHGKTHLGRGDWERAVQPKVPGGLRTCTSALILLRDILPPSPGHCGEGKNPANCTVLSLRRAGKGSCSPEKPCLLRDGRMVSGCPPTSSKWSQGHCIQPRLSLLSEKQRSECE